jgi:uncharacterized surface protein with fasciclin (FAS1) repeats
MRILTASVVLAALSCAAIGAGTAPARQAANDKTIVQTAAGDPRFTTLVSLVKRAGLTDALSGERQLTVFAPTDGAFDKVPRSTLRKLLGDKALLRRVLLYHVVAGDLKAAQIVKLRSARTLAGPSVRIRFRHSTVYLNNARTKVVQPDIAAANGTIHVINRVLLPPAR